MDSTCEHDDDDARTVPVEFAAQFNGVTRLASRKSNAPARSRIADNQARRARAAEVEASGSRWRLIRDAHAEECAPLLPEAESRSSGAGEARHIGFVELWSAGFS